MPYMYPDLNAARDMQNAGAACIMPLAAPIGSNRGVCTKEFIQILIDEIDLPVIVDAGIGKPSQACEVMEMGAAAVMANTASRRLVISRRWQLLSVKRSKPEERHTSQAVDVSKWEGQAHPRR